VDRGAGYPDRGFAALLGRDRWTALCAAGAARSYRRGQFLLRQGDRGGFVLALTSGRVQVAALNEDGTQLLQALRGAGDLVGEMAMRDGAERSATVVALDRSTVRYFSVELLRRFLTSAGAHGAFTDYLIAKLSETVHYQLQLVHFSPRQRVARLLLDVIALADGVPDPMRIPFSQTGIATALGLARSTVSEQVAALREVGVLAPGPRLRVIDVRALARIAGIGQ
jgi:CRP/FNR family transcriptional regulator, cyclic AMP receptor protein